jgi:hypothetical protein
VDLNARNNVRSRVSDGTLIYAAKVRLLAAFPASQDLVELNAGYLALFAAGSERAFLTLFDLSDFSVIIVEEIYFKFDKAYVKLGRTLWAFPSDVCMIGVQFLLESEGKEMEKQIIKATPVKRRSLGFRRLFGKGSKTKGELVVSTQETDKETGMAWDPERGYDVVGSLEDLPEEHEQFMLDQGSSDQKP